MNYFVNYCAWEFYISGILESCWNGCQVFKVGSGSPVLSLDITEKSLTLLDSLPSNSIPPHLLISRLNSPKFLLITFCIRYSSLNLFCHPFLDLLQESPSVLYCRAQTWTEHSRCVSPGLSRTEGSSPLTCWQYSSVCCTGHCSCCLLQAYIAGSWSTGCLPGPSDLPGNTAFQMVGPEHILVQCYFLLVHNLAISIIVLDEVPVCLFLQPAEVPPNGSTTIWCISHSSHFCIFSKLVSINEDVR